MNYGEKNLEQKKCGESCGCNSSQDVKIEVSKVDNQNEKTEEIKLDPTRFGDWEVKGRAIDF